MNEDLWWGKQPPVGPPIPYPFYGHSKAPSHRGPDPECPACIQFAKDVNEERVTRWTFP